MVTIDLIVHAVGFSCGGFPSSQGIVELTRDLFADLLKMAGSRFGQGIGLQQFMD